MQSDPFSFVSWWASVSKCWELRILGPFLPTLQGSGKLKGSVFSSETGFCHGQQKVVWLVLNLLSGCDDLLFVVTTRVQFDQTILQKVN